uniref:Bet v I/Major latex protein domain-containing protein n=1 Tax=Panagrolaimus superbus TaxID=310955 RepID=A0A914Z3W7_9BILA
MAAFKHHESNKSMEEVEIDVQTSVASPLLFCRKQCFKTETIWTIFWRDHEDIFGVTDGETKIFEKKIPIAERMKFCGNVSASLLTEKWRKIFTDAAFKLTFKDDDEDELEVEMTHGTVTLQRIEEPGHIKAIFNEMVEAYNKISVSC